MRLWCEVPEVRRMNYFVYVVRIRVAERTPEHKSPERRSGVRDYVMGRFQEAQGGGAPGFPR